MSHLLRQLLLVDLDLAKAAHMIVLKLPKEPYWLEPLPLGVKLKVRPFDSATAGRARAASARVVAELRQDFERRKEAGVAIDGLPDLDDPDVAEGIASQVTLQAFGRAAIVDWEGVLAEDGQTPAPVTAQTVNDLMRVDVIAQAFLRLYSLPLDMVVAEGNASAPAPNGTTAAGEKSATAAASSEPPAPAASAG